MGDGCLEVGSWCLVLFSLRWEVGCGWFVGGWFVGSSGWCGCIW